MVIQRVQSLRWLRWFTLVAKDDTALPIIICLSIMSRF